MFSQKEFALDILRQMPTEKKALLKKCLERNCILTSSYIMESGEITVYKEGWYIVLNGTRCKFSVWAYDNDGEFVFGRKPIEAKLHKIYSEFLKFSESEFKEF